MATMTDVKMNQNVLSRLAAHVRSTNEMSAAELDGVTGYKALGMTVKEVRAAIGGERRRQAAVRTERQRARQVDPKRALHKRSKGHYLRLRYEAQLWRQSVQVVSLSEAQASPDARKVVQVGRQYVRGHSDVRYDDTRYSRSWHSSHGATRVVRNRRAELVALTPHGYDAVATVPLDSFRGQWLERALSKLLGTQALAVARLTDPNRSVRERGILRLAKDR
jgi:hypothetical protein